MKKFFVAVAGTALILLAFREPNVHRSSLVQDSAGMALQQKIKAIPFHEEMTVNLADLGQSVPNLCTGETMQFVGGTLHTTVTGVVNGNNSFIIFTFNGQNTLVEAPDGTIYRGNGVQSFKEKFSLTGESRTFTYNSIFVFTTAGGHNNLIFEFRYHITVNANGEVTIEYLETSAECQ